MSYLGAQYLDLDNRMHLKKCQACCTSAFARLQVQRPSKVHLLFLQFINSTTPIVVLKYHECSRLIILTLGPFYARYLRSYEKQT